MSALTDALRGAAQAGRTAAATVAQRPTTVAIETATWSGGAAGMAGATSVTTTTTLVPAPKVVRLGGDPSAFGGGLAVAGGGDLVAPTYLVGPITRAHARGGYDPATLLPAASTTSTTRLRLSGQDFAAGGELFRAVRVERESPQSYWLIVERVGA